MILWEKHKRKTKTRLVLILLNNFSFFIFYIKKKYVSVKVKAMKSINYAKFHHEFLFKYSRFVSKHTVYKYWLYDLKIHWSLLKKLAYRHVFQKTSRCLIPQQTHLSRFLIFHTKQIVSVKVKTMLTKVNT